MKFVYFRHQFGLLSGHQWVKNNLGLSPKSGWSIDPFGHGSTVPYLLKMSGISGTVIQRIHYAWKQWLAERQMGDFLWRQNWDPDGHTDLLTHNQPFDIYSIKHSCGPHPQVCLNFDFRKIPGTQICAGPLPMSTSQPHFTQIHLTYGHLRCCSFRLIDFPSGSLHSCGFSPK